MFISHHRDDTWVARQMAAKLRRAGARTYLDEENHPVGAPFEKEVRPWLEQADEVVVHLTPWAFGRDWVRLELAVAWWRRIPIRAFLHGPVREMFDRAPGMSTLLAPDCRLDLHRFDDYVALVRAETKRRTTRP